MADLDPSIAQRVLEADIRNKVKKVGEGGTLNNTERQVFLDMTEGDLSPEAIREARALALVRKHMDGGRLSHAERDEVAHILGDASALIDEPVPLPQRKGELTQSEVEQIYKLSRAKYFRWRQIGQSVPEGPDLPPFSDPKAMVVWYERMRGRGIFKHRCPKVLKDLAAKGLPSLTAAEKPPPETPATGATSAPPAATSAQPQILEEERGFLVELEKQEIKTARERRAADEAFEKGDFENYALLNSEHRSSLELLRKMTSQKEAVGLAEKSLVKKDDVMELQAPIVKSIIKNLVCGPSIRKIYDELNLESAGIGFDAFIAAQSKHVRTCFDELVRNNLAEPLVLEAA